MNETNNNKSIRQYIRDNDHSHFRPQATHEERANHYERATEILSQRLDRTSETLEETESENEILQHNNGVLYQRYRISYIQRVRLEIEVTSLNERFIDQEQTRQKLNNQIESLKKNLQYAKQNTNILAIITLILFSLLTILISFTVTQMTSE